MNFYKRLFSCKQEISATELCEAIDAVTEWESAYMIGTRLYEMNQSEFDSETIRALDRALELGLSVKRDRECYLITTKIMAKLYFQYENYVEANNKLNLLVHNYPTSLPNWVHLFFASAQLHMPETFEVIAENPHGLFRRLDQIRAETEEETALRQAVFWNT